MGSLDGRVVVVTGAGRGIGRAHALCCASEGARIVVNDNGATVSGSGDLSAPAQVVVDEIRALGGEAVANTDDVADWDGAANLVAAAIEAYGDLHVLVNNAGILRDRMIVNLTQDEWESVVRVHLAGHAAPTHHAAVHWRHQAKAGREVRASVINTTSTSGLIGNPGQSSYGAAKAGVAAFTLIAAQELGRYGVRVNAIAPAARTRMTDTTPGLAEIVRAPANPDAFDVWEPANVSPVVAVLAAAPCTITGQVFFIQGGEVRRFVPWTIGPGIDNGGRWSVEELTERIGELDG
jgi:NAD(P)-dependent dehydrogenase (short-subunit alcohol dehydrogenase family)